MDKLKNLFAGNSSAKTSVQEPAAVAQKDIFKDVSLNDFTQSPSGDTPDPAFLQSNFSVPENLRPTAPTTENSVTPHDLTSATAPNQDEITAKRSVDEYGIPRSAYSQDYHEPSEKSSTSDALQPADQVAGHSSAEPALSGQQRVSYTETAQDIRLEPEHLSPEEGQRLVGEYHEMSHEMHSMVRNQQKLIQAAQFQPFEVNYQSKSPNYDDLAKERQQHTKDNAISSFNDKEVLPLRLSFILFCRQLVAALFSHTTLSVLLPQLSMRFGPCYPGSMALPYLLTGALSGTLSAVICAYTDMQSISGGFCVTAFILCSGLTSFRGLSELVGLLTRRRPDTMLNAASLMLPILLLNFMINVLYICNEPFEAAIFFALSSTVAACFASTLCFDLKQDPVDSFGTMSLKGLLVCAILIVALCFIILKPYAACSVLGLGMLLRLLLGHYYVSHNILASRQIVCAVLLIIMLCLIFNLLLYSLNRNLLNNQIYNLLQAHHLITAVI